MYTYTKWREQLERTQRGNHERTLILHRQLYLRVGHGSRPREVLRVRVFAAAPGVLSNRVEG